MSEILQAVGSPIWWFSTIIVAIIANVIANYIYDALKEKMAGHWGLVSIWFLYISFSALLIASIFALPIPSDKAVQLAAGFALAKAFGIYEVYKIPAYGFAESITTALVFCVTFFEPEFPRALADRDLNWFGQQFFYCTLMSVFIQVVVHGLFFRRHLRKHRGLAH